MKPVNNKKKPTNDKKKPVNNKKKPVNDKKWPANEHFLIFWPKKVEIENSRYGIKPKKNQNLK